MPYIVPLDIPKNCLECPFLSKPDYILDTPDKRGTYIRMVIPNVIKNFLQFKEY